MKDIVRQNVKREASGWTRLMVYYCQVTFRHPVADFIWGGVWGLNSYWRAGHAVSLVSLVLPPHVIPLSVGFYRIL
jgi:hypothetical protein